MYAYLNTALLVLLVVSVVLWLPFFHMKLGDIATQLKRIADNQIITNSKQ